MITVKDMLREMNTGRPFTVTVVTYNQDKKTGGGIRTMEAKVIKAAEILGRQPTEQEKKAWFDHKTSYIRRVALLVNGHPVDQVRNIRIPLVLEFNGQELKH